MEMKNKDNNKDVQENLGSFTNVEDLEFQNKLLEAEKRSRDIVNSRVALDDEKHIEQVLTQIRQRK